jgi:hypothetical protein
VWTVVYVAANKSIAEMLKEILDEEGLSVMLRPSGIPHSGASGTYDILVPESEAEEAALVITGIIGGV